MPTTVLIADDYQDIRLTLRTLLEDEGYSVLESATASETLRILRDATEPLVVLLDLLMGENGGNVIGIVAQDVILAKRHRFILVTAVDTPRIPPAIARHGFPVVSKPFDIDEILRIIRQAAQSQVPPPQGDEGMDADSA